LSNFSLHAALLRACCSRVKPVRVSECRSRCNIWLAEYVVSLDNPSYQVGSAKTA
jgi:hypothetical protein